MFLWLPESKGKGNRGKMQQVGLTTVFLFKIMIILLYVLKHLNASYLTVCCCASRIPGTALKMKIGGSRVRVKNAKRWQSEPESFAVRSVLKAKI